MPIASGAKGRADGGADASTANGVKRNTKPNRNCDSYLQLYQEQKKKNKINVLPNVQEHTAVSVQDESEVAKEEIPQRNSSTEDQTSGKTTSGEGSKKSQLCVLL